MSKDLEIACPKCDWQPDASSRWSCSCGCSWNTFDTAARCPQCGKQWEYTQCLAWRCNKFSLHLDWYRNLGDLLKEELESINEAIEVV